MDVINLREQLIFFLNSIKFLSPSGYYIIEDVFYKDKNKFLDFLKRKSSTIFLLNYLLKKKIKDNNLFIIKK